MMATSSPSPRRDQSVSPRSPGKSQYQSDQGVGGPDEQDRRKTEILPSLVHRFEIKERRLLKRAGTLDSDRKPSKKRGGFSRQTSLTQEEIPEDVYAPCIVNGVCQLCQSRSATGLWGNPRCRGCAMVDTCPFRNHLFRPLLVDWHPELRPEAAVAVWPMKKVERVDLTPPPLGRTDMLRG